MIYFRQRTRNLPALSDEEKEYRRLLMKKWAVYRNQEILKDYQAVDRMVSAQKKALEELKLESEELYQAAIQPDPAMIPLTINGPVQTPPIKDYAFVDGDYINTTKVYEGETPEQ